MSRYQLEYGYGVEDTINSLPGNVRQRVRRTIVALRDNPYPPEAQQMRDDLAHLWCIYIDQWRIVYSVDDLIYIVEIVLVRRKSGPNRGPSFYKGLGSSRS